MTVTMVTWQLTWWWVLAEITLVASPSHTTISASDPLAITPYVDQAMLLWIPFIVVTLRGYILKILAATVLVTATKRQGSILPDDTPFSHITDMRSSTPIVSHDMMLLYHIDAWTPSPTIDSIWYLCKIIFSQSLLVSIECTVISSRSVQCSTTCDNSSKSHDITIQLSDQPAIPTSVLPLAHYHWWCEWLRIKGSPSNVMDLLIYHVAG